MANTHAFIGMLAQALYEYDVQIRLSTLGKILHDKGEIAYRDGFDIGSIVAAAYHYWALRDAETAKAIRYAFTGEDGALLPSVLAVNEQITRASREHSSR